jgi:excisionase family DNA binding protein
MDQPARLSGSTESGFRADGSIDASALMAFRTPTEAANELGKSKARIKQLIRDGQLQAIRTRLGFLISPASINRLQRMTSEMK